MHDAVAGHAVPHIPQLAASVVVSVQPLAQQVVPGPHDGPPLHGIAGWHMPPAHVSPAMQAFPQVAQLFGSVAVSVHPVVQQVCVPVHAAPPLQPIGWHMLATQVFPAGQATPHPPQFLGSLVVSKQPFGQHFWTPPHGGPPLQVIVGVHVPERHTSPGLQAIPQPPQLSVSSLVLVHPPGQHFSPPKQGGPPKHVNVDLHVLATQVSPGAHTLPQPPQLFASLVVSLQPLPQHFCPGKHGGPPLQVVAGLQTLAAQVLPIGQETPQPPQLAGSLVVSLQPVAQHCCEPAHDGPPLHPRAG